MTERLLQFIWEFQYFNKRDLETITGERIQILQQGRLNANQGPDFSDARIRIGETMWAGNVELHVRGSDWNKHGHQHDQHYRNVVLHVVWTHDSGPSGDEAPGIPVLELRNRVSKILLGRYEEMMNTGTFIPCESAIGRIKKLTWTAWKDRLVAERLTRKAMLPAGFSRQNNHHWEETCWWMLARNFGIVVNADAFEEVARTIPISVLSKLKHHPLLVEAILFGQAGLLQDSYTDEYPQALLREYRFLQQKFNLRPVNRPILFLRMRPGNFPTIRMAQLAALINSSEHLFSAMLEADSVEKIKSFFDVTASAYWDNHYRFDEMSPEKKKNLGEGMIENIIINTVSPLLFAYGTYHRQEAMQERALNWLEALDPENHTITTRFQQLGIRNRHAFDSQALTELKNEYCNKKRCLDCAVGTSLLRGL